MTNCYDKILDMDKQFDFISEFVTSSVLDEESFMTNSLMLVTTDKMGLVDPGGEMEGVNQNGAVGSEDIPDYDKPPDFKILNNTFSLKVDTDNKISLYVSCLFIILFA